MFTVYSTLIWAVLVQQIGFVTWDPYTVHRGSCLDLYYCNMVSGSGVIQAWSWRATTLVCAKNESKWCRNSLACGVLEGHELETTIHKTVNCTAVKLLLNYLCLSLWYSAIQQVFDMTFFDSISICLQLLTSLPHNHLLPTCVTSATSFFLL